MRTSETWYPELARSSVQDTTIRPPETHEQPLIVCLQRPVPPLLERAFRHLAGMFLLASVLVLWLSWEAYDTSMTIKALVPDMAITQFDNLIIVVPEHLIARLARHQRTDPFPLVLGIGALVCGLLGWLGVRQALQQKQTVFDEFVPSQEPTQEEAAIPAGPHKHLAQDRMEPS